MYAEFAFDPKVQSMSEAMQRRYVMLMCLRCAGMSMTDEYVAHSLRLTAADLEETKKLFIDRGFIDENWTIRNWDKRQFKSDSSTQRVRKHRHRRNDTKRSSNGGEAFQKRKCNALEQSREEQSREDQKKRVARARNRATTLPSDFEITPEMITWATGKGFTPEFTKAQFEQFADHHRAKGSTFKDWVAAFRTWMRRSKSFPGGLTAAAKKQEVSYAPEP